MISSRSTFSVYGEKSIEWIVRLCGVSAILFVFAIFYFVFSEGRPLLASSEFSVWKFLTSSEWYPTSVSNIRYGTFALLAGTLSVTGVAMLIAVPFGLGAAIFVSEFSRGKV